MNKATLLILDDEIFIREMLSEFFATCDYNVLCAANEKEALKIISENEIDTALIDLNLDDTDGINVLRNIKQKDLEISVIIMTGYPTIDSSVAALREGAVDYIIKPFRLQEIRKIVQRAVKIHRKQIEFKLLRDRSSSMKTIIREGTRELRFKCNPVVEPKIVEGNSISDFQFNTEKDVESIINIE